jgi:hypothetical protein
MPVNEVEEFLSTKNWKFYHAHKATKAGKNSSLSFSYGGNNYNKKVQKMVDYMYFESIPDANQITYTCTEQSDYQNLVEQSKALGYKFLEASTFDNEYCKIYKKGNIALFFISKKDKNGNNMYELRIVNPSATAALEE